MAKKERDSKKTRERETDEIKVTDRRKFTLDGEFRDEADALADVDDEPVSPSSADAEPVSATTGLSDGGVAGEREEDREFEHRSVEEPEGVDITMLINAMAQQALIFLGEIALPGSDKAEVNLEQARLQIDLLDLLRVKCRGNLTADEEGLMDHILYKLRMLYVTRSNQPMS